MTLLSIVMPVYNKADYLDQCLKSIIAQSFTDFEVICVDDCSTDSSLSILQQYKNVDSRIKIISHPINMGPHLSRYDGVLSSTGQYLRFIDADDSLDLDSFNQSIVAIKKSGTDIVHFSVNVCPEEGVDKKLTSSIINFTKYYEHSLNGDEVLKGFLDGKFKWHLWDKIYSSDTVKKAFSEIGPRKIWVGEDYLEMLFICIYASSYTYSPEQIYNYHYGRGLYGLVSDITVKRLIKDCSSVELFKCSYEYAKSNRSVLDDSILDNYPLNRLDQCINTWKKLRTIEERAEGKKILVDYWKDTKYIDKIYREISTEEINTNRTDIHWRMIAYNNPLSKTKEYHQSSVLYEKSIVSFINDNDFLQSCVFIKSLSDSLIYENKCNLVIYYTQLSDLNQYKLKKLVLNNNINLIFVDASNFYDSFDLDLDPRQFSELSIFNPFIKSGVYISCNSIIKQNISDIIEYSSNQTISMVKEPIITSQDMLSRIAELRLDDLDYADSNLIIFNSVNSKFDKQYIVDIIVQYNLKNGNELINMLFKNDIGYVNCNWNFKTSVYEKNTELPGIFPIETEELYNDALIITYSRNYRPWNNPHNMIFTCFWDTMRSTPFYEQLLLTVKHK